MHTMCTGAGVVQPGCRSGQVKIGLDPTRPCMRSNNWRLLTSYGDISKVWSTTGFDLNQHLKYFLQFSGSFELGIAIHLFLWTHGDEIYAVVRVDLLMWSPEGRNLARSMVQIVSVISRPSGLRITICLRLLTCIGKIYAVTIMDMQIDLLRSRIWSDWWFSLFLQFFGRPKSKLRYVFSCALVQMRSS